MDALQEFRCASQTGAGETIPPEHLQWKQTEIATLDIELSINIDRGSSGRRLDETS